MRACLQEGTAQVLAECVIKRACQNFVKDSLESYYRALIIRVRRGGCLKSPETALEPFGEWVGRRAHWRTNYRAKSKAFCGRADCLESPPLDKLLGEQLQLQVEKPIIEPF